MSQYFVGDFFFIIISKSPISRYETHKKNQILQEKMQSLLSINTKGTNGNPRKRSENQIASVPEKN